MRPTTIGGAIFGLVVSAGVAAAMWFLIAKPLIDKATESNNERQAAGVAQFRKAVAKVNRQLGGHGRLVSVTPPPSNAEFVTSVDGPVAHALRWKGGEKLESFEE